MRSLEAWQQILLERYFDEDKDAFLQIFDVTALQDMVSQDKEAEDLSQDLRFRIHSKYYWINTELMPDAAHGQITVTFRNVMHRYEYDEFVVFMTYKQEDDIKDIVERIFQSVSCQYEGHAISISMGICLSSACDGGYYDLYKKADKSLYDAKAGGKGRYVYYSPD